MSYRISAKNRRLKRTVLRVLSMIKFDGINMNNAQKTVIFWTVLSFISLFLPWIEIIQSGIINNAFSKILGISGFIILLLNICILYLAFHHKNKEIYKNILHIFMKDGVGITFLSIFLLLTISNAIFIIEGLKTFQQWIILWNGILVWIVGSIFSIVWWIFLSREKNIPTLFNSDAPEIHSLEDFLQHESKVDEKNNMKLPF